MPVPVQDTAYATEAQGLIISQYALQQIIPGLIKTFAQECQTLENAVFSLINGMTLAAQPLGFSANWDILDKLGGIVGLERMGQADADYLAAIKIKIRVNRSNGLADDIIAITALLVTGATYFDWPLLSWEIYIPFSSNSIVNALLNYLGEAKAEGSAGYVNYPAAGGFWTLADAVSNTLGSGLCDAVSGEFAAASAPVSLAPVVSS